MVLLKSQHTNMGRRIGQPLQIEVTRPHENGPLNCAARPHDLRLQPLNRGKDVGEIGAVTRRDAVENDPQTLVDPVRMRRRHVLNAYQAGIMQFQLEARGLREGTAHAPEIDEAGRRHSQPNEVPGFTRKHGQEINEPAVINRPVQRGEALVITQTGPGIELEPPRRGLRNVIGCAQTGARWTPHP